MSSGASATSRNWSSPSRLSRKVTPRNPPRHKRLVFRPGVIQDIGSLESRGGGRDSAGEAGSMVGLHDLGDVVAQQDLEHHTCKNGEMDMDIK